MGRCPALGPAAAGSIVLPAAAGSRQARVNGSTVVSQPISPFGLRDCVHIRPGPVNSTTMPSPDFIAVEIPPAVRSFISRVSSYATRCPESTVTDSAARGWCRSIAPYYGTSASAADSTTQPPRTTGAQGSPQPDSSRLPTPQQFPPSNPPAFGFFPHLPVRDPHYIPLRVVPESI